MLYMMPKFGLILVLLLAKTLAQEELEPIFRAVGETLELGFCFAVDFIAVYKIKEGEKQLLWNSSYSVLPPDAYRNRLNASSSFHGLLGVQVVDLELSDSGTYLRECWDKGRIINQHTNYLHMCDERVPAEELSLENGGALITCGISYSEQDSTNIKWFREVNPGYKISLFLDTEKSQDLLQKELDDVIQVQDKGFSLYVLEAGLEHSHHFFCLVMKTGQCKSFKTITLPESHKNEMHSVYYGVGEKAALSCMSELNRQQNYWTTPFGEVGATAPHGQMYISSSDETRDHPLIIPSITLNHSGEYKCLSKVVVVEYYITVCTELVSDYVMLYNGGKVTLACTLTQDESANILWYRQRDLMEAQLIYDSGDPSIDIPADLMGRATILESNASLIITKLNETDSGTYWCIVLLDSMGQDIDDSLVDGDEEDDNIDDDSEWIEEEENMETCIIKTVTQLRVQPKNLKRGFDVESSLNPGAESESSPVPYALIGGMLGIVILGLIIAVVVVKMRAKRKALDSGRADSTAQQKDSVVSAPLMSL